jgi:hypothetical protein
MPTRSVRFLTALVCAVVFVACSDSTGPILPRDGVYTLVAVNDTTLPYPLFQNATNGVFIESNQLTVSSIRTWSEKGSTRYVTNGQTTLQPTSDNGTWIASDTLLVLLSGNRRDTAYTGSFSSDRITLLRGVQRFTFRLSP